MKISISREKFLDALQKVVSIIGSRSTLPVLANVLIEAGKDKIILTTTDLEIRITTEIECKVEETGKTTLPAKKLLSVIKELPGGDLDLKGDENHHISIQCGKSLFKLLGLAPDDFPQPVSIIPVRTIRLTQLELARIFGQISYAVSIDDSRKVLNGILLSIKENTFTVVATDGKRLALVEKVMEKYEGEEGDSIVPSRSANEIARIIQKEGEVIIEIGENQASFKAGNTVMTTKLVEGNYPNYRQVIPTSFSKKVQIPSAEFSSALRRVSLVVSESSSFVKMTFNKTSLLLHASSSEFGESKESIDIEYGGPELNISFNPIFLSDPFRNIDADKVTLQMNDGYSPVAISGGEGFLYVIMPVRSK
ncbi:MAG: DNA polymerase III subunit beta [Lentisphaerae bacterium GWF2_49_21]|nr:MAG: DNA polymerase III subunit beta [Lentisphaerae bacterium GWF2_49_21]